MDAGKLILLDGNSLLYRAFFALPPMSAPDGRPTNAVYGFMNMLLRLCADERPDYIAVAFDKSRVTFRHGEFADYKATRAATPDDLRPQFALLREVLGVLGVSACELEGFEADDIIGTLSRTGSQNSLEVLIVTGDRDALQLISPQTQVLLTRRGITETERYDLRALHGKYGLSPDQMIELKGLMGDQSDNIPGVPGVGEKTALKLLHEYGTIDELLARLGEMKGGKLAEKLSTYAPQALLSRRLATIVRDAPISLDLAEMRCREPDYPALRELFTELGFRSLLNRLDGPKAAGEDAAATPATDKETSGTPPYRVVEVAGAAELEKLAAAAARAGEFVFQSVTGGNGHLDSDLQGVAIAWDPCEIYYLPLQGEDESDRRNTAAALEILRGVLEDAGVAKACSDGKREIIVLRQNGIELRGLAFDPQIAAYLLNPSRTNYRLEDLEREHLGTDFLAGDLSPAGRVWATGRLRTALADLLKEKGLSELFARIEMPLTAVLAGMEIAGVKVDAGQLALMAEDLADKIAAVTQEIYDLAGTEFNINSPKQMGEVLFGKLGLPVIKRTKTGYSTDVGVLEKLAVRHPIADRILAYRHLVKLKGTYVDGLLTLINPETGRVHTTFNQTVTTTGRISSTEPNLQNIPIRTELGREIRKAFVPRDREWVILAADYSQIELRLLAHISGDETLRTSFVNAEDIHARTAAEVFGVSIGEVTGEMRSRAKAVNFGIIYGISDYGLSQNLRVSRETAKEYIDNYFARYPRVREYMDAVIAAAQETGYVTTLFNRRRYLPDLHNRNRNIRAFAERTAMNTPIQGSAADIIKLAMVNIAARLCELELRTVLVLQVHDELVFEVPPDELATVQELVRREMEGVYQLSVPLKVDTGTGPNWYDVK